MAAGIFNAISGAQRAGTVLDSIAHPTILNPVADIGAAAQTANSMYDVRQKMANQAIGQILQQNTDANGNVDYAGAQRAAAAGGPIVAAGMANMLKDTSMLRSQQIQNAAANMHLIGSSALSAINDQSDKNINAIMDGLAARGLPQDQVDRERARWLGMTNPADRKQEALRLAYTNLDGLVGLNRQTGTREAVQTGGSTEFPVIPSPEQGGNVSVQATPSPETRFQLQPSYIPLDANGQPTTPDKAQRWIPLSVPRPGQGNLPPQGPAPITRQPPAPGSTAPPPPPKGTNVIPGGYPQPGSTTGPRSDIPSGTQVAAGDNFVPANVGPAAAPSPAVAGDVAAIQAGQAQGRAAPRGGTQTAQYMQLPGGGTGIITGPPMGTKETLENDIKARTDASLGAGDQARNLQAGEKAFEALNMAGNYTGAGTGTSSSLYAWLQARAPEWAVPQGQMTDTAWRQVLAKNLLRFAQAQGMRMNTDLGMTEALAGSANADAILPNANREILIDDIGRARQRVAQTQLMPPPSTDGAVVKHFQTYTNDTDFRAFSWDLRSPAERKAIEEEVAKDPTGKAQQRLDQGLEDANKVGLIKVPGAPPKQGRQGAAQPAPANPLAMAAPAASSANALAFAA